MTWTEAAAAIALALLSALASGCKDDEHARPVRGPNAPPTSGTTSGTTRGPQAVAASASASSATAAAGQLPPLDPAKLAANESRLNALMPKAGVMPAKCSVKKVGGDAPAWLAANPHVGSNPTFISGFTEAALPGADARQIETGLYLVYEQAGEAGNTSQVGLFVFTFRAAEDAAFGKKVFAQSRPANPERFAVMQRGALLLVQWRDGEPGPCWEALRKWTLEQAPK